MQVSQINLMVFDQCECVTKRHPGNLLMQYFYVDQVRCADIYLTAFAIGDLLSLFIESIQARSAL